MNKPSARVIKQSITPDGVKVTTAELTFWRPMLAEFNTHAFSRNSESSRAVPFPKRLQKVIEDCAGPLIWRLEKKGMQGGDELPLMTAAEADQIWIAKAAEKMVEVARELADLGVHKSLVNRLLEPFLMHTVVATSTQWENFFDQRCSPLAQDDIRVPAELLRDAMANTVPRELTWGAWHLPYIGLEDWTWAINRHAGDFAKAEEILAAVSAARCAQLSYQTQPQFDPETGEVVRPGGELDPERDLARYETLMGASPKHWSPLEHPAKAHEANRQRGVLWVDGKEIDLNRRPKTGKLLAYLPLRTVMEARLGEDTYR